MPVWLLEFGSGWEGMTPQSVHLTEKKGLKAYHKARKQIAKRTGLRVQWCTETDGSHVSAPGSERLRLRPVVLLA